MKNLKIISIGILIAAVLSWTLCLDAWAQRVSQEATALSPEASRYLQAEDIDKDTVVKKDSPQKQQKTFLESLMDALNLSYPDDHGDYTRFSSEGESTVANDSGSVAEDDAIPALPGFKPPGSDEED